MKTLAELRGIKTALQGLASSAEAAYKKVNVQADAVKGDTHLSPAGMKVRLDELCKPIEDALGQMLGEAERLLRDLDGQEVYWGNPWLAFRLTHLSTTWTPERIAALQVETDHLPEPMLDLAVNAAIALQDCGRAYTLSLRKEPLAALLPQDPEPMETLRIAKGFHAEVERAFKLVRVSVKELPGEGAIFGGHADKLAMARRIEGGRAANVRLAPK
ncbi:hypothetical protein [Geothrix sp. PMB-07]|uniref:hypothetical protein n=1 Tax=Geothrix sp. PMB-07 TaxID=3068640 RepID=UPI0027429D41|nr:hypothetical protein [Geothrix sp. PMB-07]WLT33018.1 hypothetical protein Q9293_06735 [Geothrix sp. PMB-07]